MLSRVEKLGAVEIAKTGEYLDTTHFDYPVLMPRCHQFLSHHRDANE